MSQCAREGMTCHDKQCAKCWAILIRFRGLAAPTSLIHLTAQEGCSPNSGCTIVHKTFSPQADEPPPEATRAGPSSASPSASPGEGLPRVCAPA